jgi:LDH2 family malate/lactate/ureidoglycolate dehydrogenase
VALQGTVLPFGDPKGYALALLVEVLSGSLSGAMFGLHLNDMWTDFKNPKDVRHCFGALDVSKFTDLQVLKERMDQLIREIKRVPKARNVPEIFMPGEIEYQKAGIPLPEVVFEDLRKLGDKWRVPFTLE